MATDSTIPQPLVLVVDDDFNMRLLVSETLEQAGFRVAEAETGRHALEAFDRGPPDIVLTDAMMPELDGFALCAELRRRPTGPLKLYKFIRQRSCILKILETANPSNRRFSTVYAIPQDNQHCFTIRNTV